MKNRDLVLHILENYFGVKEIPGPKSNPVILDIQRWALPKTQDDTKVAWCSIALSYLIDHRLESFGWILLACNFLSIGIVIEWMKNKSVGASRARRQDHNRHVTC